MAYFPQPHPANRQRRLKVGGSVVVAIRSEGAQVVRAKLHELSLTGGLLVLSKAFTEGDFVEVAFSTSKGTVHGMAEFLRPKNQSISGCLQPFKFVALEDEDQSRLQTALESLADQTIVGVRSSRLL